MNMRNIFPFLLMILVVVTLAACGGTPPTTPVRATPTGLVTPTVSPTVPPPTNTAVPTNTPTATITLTPTPSTPTATPTRTRTATSQFTPVARATATTAFKPPPAPHGSIAYHSNKDGIDRTYIINLSTTPFNTTPLVDIGPVMDLTLDDQGTNAHWGDWSPDNSKFAFISTGAPSASQILRVYDFRTEPPERRNLDSSDTGGGLSSPSWSSDGKKIAYIRMSSDKRAFSLQIVSYDQTADPADRIKVVRTNASGEQYRGGVTWQKQGLLAFAANTTGSSDVYSVDVNNAGLANLTNNPADDSSPAWSPDGKTIAFTSTRDGKPQIYLMNADGSGVHRLSNGAAQDFSPSWSQDGNWIAFTTMRDGLPNIYIMDTRGGSVQRITTNGGDHPVWSH